MEFYQQFLSFAVFDRYWRHKLATMPKVWNHRDTRIPPGAVYVGRPSPFGNPFSHLPDTTAQWHVPTRDTAIDAFEAWVYTQPELIERIRRELYGKDLVCWCAPKRCHADVLLAIANGLPLDNHQDLA